MSSLIARKVVQHFHLLGPSVDEEQNLSPRERQVLDLVAMGFIYKEIGSKLDIGTETVAHLRQKYLPKNARPWPPRSGCETPARIALSKES